MEWNSVLITGGTGSFGKAFLRVMLDEYKPERLVIFSRDELKQHEMRMEGLDHSSVRYFVGDVRDQERLKKAMRDVETVIHAAALKQVPACEYNPFEAVKTNILGAQNVIDAALYCGVWKVMALSTDKAVNPVNLYGATKLCAEKLFIHGNAYSGGEWPNFSCVRYGNVAGSRGSVLPLFLKQRETGQITVTDRRMTRFWITLEQGVRFVIQCVERMQGGEVFVPKIPSMRIWDLAKAIAPDCEVEEIGIRPGEKLHEVLISQDEPRVEAKDIFIVQRGERGPAYSSDTNAEFLSVEKLRGLGCFPMADKESMKTI